MTQPDELARLRAENQELRDELDALRRELEELRLESDLDACHAAGLAAQAKALIAEGDACPCKEAHPLLERTQFINERTGEPMTKTRSYPYYRVGFDAQAAEYGIENPEQYRG